MTLATTETPRKAHSRTLSPDEFRRLTERTGVAQHVPTAEAAALLNVAPQTMRRWACEGSGPLRPVRINGRLRWSVDAIAAVLSGSAKPVSVPA
jgi:Helix-turn-helix domain